MCLFSWLSVKRDKCLGGAGQRCGDFLGVESDLLAPGGVEGGNLPRPPVDRLGDGEQVAGIF